MDDKLTDDDTPAERPDPRAGARPENSGSDKRQAASEAQESRGAPTADEKSGILHRHEVRIVQHKGTSGESAEPRSRSAVRVEPESAGTEAKPQKAEAPHDDSTSGPTAEPVTPTVEPVTPTAAPHRVKADLRTQEVVRGSHPGDRYVRYDRSVGPFRRKGGGVLAASIEAGMPRSACRIASPI